MKEMKFTLKTNDKVIINERYKYFIVEDKINIKSDDSLIKIDLKEKTFTKKNNESLINIDIKKEIANIKLLEENLNLEIELLKSKFLVSKSDIRIEYMLDDGENNLNTIIIKYI